MSVPEQLFKPDQVTAVVEVLDGEAVAQRVGTHLFGESGTQAGGTYDVLHTAHGDATGDGFSGGTGEEVVRRMLGAEMGDKVAA